MSSVRMCDRCGTVFSELADGWQTYQAATFKKDDEGRRISVSVMMDACPACAINADEPAAVTRQDDGFFQRQLLEGRVADLEAELRRKNEDTPEPAEEAEHEPVVPAPPPASA